MTPPSDLTLLRRWIAARIRMILRTPRALFFTLAFPLVILLLFGGLNHDTQVAAAGGAGGDVDFAQFYTPSIGIFALTAACYSSLVIGISTARDKGLLKRVRGTPLPMSTYLASWITGAALTGIASVILMFAVAIPVLDVHLYPRLLPAAAVTLVIGAATLAALGVAVASLVKDADQAQPVAQLTFLPLSFISGIWYPLSGAPDWLVTLANIFPLAHLVDAFDACFQPQTTGSGFAWGHLAVVAAWGVAGLLVAVRRFQAEPNAGEHVRLRARLSG
jgi:ABC-2 type transport system permease protein